MRVLSVIIVLLALAPALSIADDKGEIGAGDLQSIAGKWKPIESSHHLLDEQLVKSGRAGFELTIDKTLGDSHRKMAALPRNYFEEYASYLKKRGHIPLATGHIKFDDSSDGEFVIAAKNGSLYLWYGVVFGGNPRIFLGRGAKKRSADRLVVEWSSACSDSPLADLESEFGTVIYERADRDTTRPKQK